MDASEVVKNSAHAEKIREMILLFNGLLDSKATHYLSTKDETYTLVFKTRKEMSFAEKLDIFYKTHKGWIADVLLRFSTIYPDSDHCMEVLVTVRENATPENQIPKADGLRLARFQKDLTDISSLSSAADMYRCMQVVAGGNYDCIPLIGKTTESGKTLLVCMGVPSFSILQMRHLFAECDDLTDIVMGHTGDETHEDGKYASYVEFRFASTLPNKRQRKS